jgi:HK97 gp10 family phage protein
MLASLRTLGTDLTTAARESVRVATHAARDDARATSLFADQSGALRRSISSVVTFTNSSATGKVSTHKQYALFVEAGTSPHMIQAYNTQALHFVVGGVHFFRPFVFHPGTQPRPFMAHALGVGTEVLEYELRSRVDHAITSFQTAA